MLVADLGVIDDFGNEFLLIILILIVEVKVSILHIKDVSQCLAVSVFLLSRSFIARERRYLPCGTASHINRELQVILHADRLGMHQRWLWLLNRLSLNID